MKACPDHQETLYLDVYGELNSENRSEWERHLKTCPGCREERRKLLGLLQVVREKIPTPQLSAEKVNALSWSIKRGLRDQRATTGWWKRILAAPNRLIPTLAVASLLIVALGWFSISKLQDPSSFENLSTLQTGEKMIVKDLEVINNLDLLEEMDTLKKLVQVVDNRDII